MAVLEYIELNAHGNPELMYISSTLLYILYYVQREKDTRTVLYYLHYMARREADNLERGLLAVGGMCAFLVP